MTPQKNLAASCAVFSLSVFLQSVPAAVLNVPGAHATLQAAMTAASPGDTISLAAGTYVQSGTVSVNKANITIQGASGLTSIIQVSLPAVPAELFNVSATGVTIQGLKIEKTDKAGVHNLIYAGANNLTIKDCEISGQYVMGDGDVSRAMVVTYGISGLLIQSNSIHGLRQPAYINGSLASPTTGTIAYNYIYGTRGWVIDGANMTFTGNTWGTGVNANYLDIAILAATPAAYYPDTVALSAANNDAAVQDQRLAGGNLTDAYVDDSAAPGGDGTVTKPCQTITAGITKVMTNGTVHVAAGNYPEAVVVNKSLTLLGADSATPCGGSQSVINAGISGTAITVAATDVTIMGFELQGAMGLKDDGYAGLVAQNNKVTAGMTGMDIEAIAGAFTLKDNCVSVAAKEVSLYPAIGILLADISGSGAQLVEGNNISGPLYGYLLSHVKAAQPLRLNGGTITAVMQGVAVFNYDMTLTVQEESEFVVDGVSMSGFTGTSAVSSRNFHAGVYVFTGGSDATAVLTGTITNVTINGTGKTAPDSAGLAFADFSTAAGIRQNITVVNCTVTNNLNRGVQARGSNAVVSVSGSSIVNNGGDPYGAGGNDGFGIIARNKATLTVNNCFVANPPAQAAYTVYALEADANTLPEGPTLVVSNCSVLSSGNGKLARQSAGTLNASANYWGTASASAIAALMVGAVDFTPYLDGGADASGSPGFQGDLSSLHVTALGSQSGGAGRVQEGLNRSANGALTGGNRVVDLGAGTYVENVEVYQPVKLLGPNAAINPNTGSRVAEAILKPATSDPDPNSSSVVLVYSYSSDVTVQGLTLDGDNPALTSGVNMRGVDVDAIEAISSYEGVSGVTIANNIVKNLSYAGLDFYNYFNGGGATSGNHIQDNRFQNIGYAPYGYGIGVLIYNNFYAEISGNVMTDVRVGIQTGNFYGANPGTTQSIHHNTIAATRRGLFHNLAYSGASAFTINDNTFTAVDEATATRWDGIMLSSIAPPVTAVVQNNTIVATPITQTTVGYQVWNDTATLTLQGGSVTGAGYGVWVNNYDGYGPSNGGSTTVNVNGVAITNASLAGVYVKDNPLNSNGATVRANVTGNTSISGCAAGVLVQGADASAAVSNNPASLTGNGVGVDVDGGKARVDNNNLSGNTVAAIRAGNGAVVDAGDCTGGNITGLGASAGGNNLTGYLTGGAKAVINNASTVRAHNNGFGATIGQSLSPALSGPVSASQSGGLLVKASLAGGAVECPGDVPAAVSTLAGFLGLGGAVSATDSVTVTNSDSAVTGPNAPHEGTVTRTYTLTDACGQSSASTQIFTIDDTTLPVVTTWPTNRTLVVGGSCTLAVPDLTAEVAATDNCGAVNVTQNPAAGALVSVGATNVTVTAADNGSNSVSQVVALTILDNQVPSITCPANVTVNRLDATDPYGTGTAAAADNCTVASVTYSDNRAGLTGCDATGNLVRTWTVTDGAGNTTNCTQVITVTDTIPPVFTSVQPAIVASNDAGQCTAVVAFGTPTAVDVGYDQGFENAAWQSGDHQSQPSVDWNDYNSHIVRASSGTDGITSKSGAAHAVIHSTVLPPAPDDFSGAFCRLGGYDKTFGTGFRTAVAVYLDLTDPAVTGNTYGWDLSCAANNQSGNHRRDFIFHVASDAGGNLLVAADNNSNFARRNDLAGLNHHTVTASGWHTFEWNFRDNGSGALAVDCNLRDAAGTLLWTETRSDPTDLIATVVGGKRYLWFTFLAVDKLAMDNVRLERNATVINTPASGSVFALGTTIVTNTATDHCGNTATQTFTVTVADSEPPVVALWPTNRTLAIANLCGQLAMPDLTGEVGATDCTGVSVAQSPAAGELVNLGATNVVVSVRDEASNTVSQTVLVTVADTHVIALSPATLSNGLAGITYGQQLLAGGGNTPYTYYVTSGSLPGGMYLVHATGTLGGVPTAVGTNVFTVTATDGCGRTGSQTYTVVVAPNPFVAAAGQYAGLFMTNGVVSYDDAGFLTVKVSPKPNNRGAFSGKIYVSGNWRPVAGTFNVDGSGISTPVSRSKWGKPTLTVRLNLPLDDSDTISGSVSNHGNGVVADFVGDRAAGGTNADGRYTLLIPGAQADSAVLPGGSGYGLVTISGGVIKVLGSRLGDNQPFTPVAVSRSKDGYWPLYSVANSTADAQKHSVIMGWVLVSNGMHGTLTWIKQPGNGRYPAGFSADVDVSGSPYFSNPAVLGSTRVIDMPTGWCDLAGGYLSDPIHLPVTLSTANVFTFDTNRPPEIKAKLVTKTGKVSGTFKPKELGLNTTPFYGVVLTNRTSIEGFFLPNVGANKEQTGWFMMSP